MKKSVFSFALIASLGHLAVAAMPAAAGDTDTKAVTVQMDVLSADGKIPAGTIKISESKHGLVFTPDLHSITPGTHGFHMHTNPSCETAEKNGKTVLGGAAGGHYDPENTGKHGHPWGEDNHLGDLPALYAGEDGIVVTPVLAPRLKMSDLEGRSLMIHAGGDNYSDHPAKLGGGGARLACGVI
ncbi:superoxide dismutase [Cu-Zn] SodC [Kiloniella sp. b19]|uniref:superoxide dismutase [Cu-Zn] SodC n=1 Tax=Kiloniella sp. GXU_MW_B19 TaxID=3141326 RepID=UPI0031D5F845